MISGFFNFRICCFLFLGRSLGLETLSTNTRHLTSGAAPVSKFSVLHGPSLKILRRNTRIYDPYAVEPKKKISAKDVIWEMAETIHGVICGVHPWKSSSTEVSVSSWGYPELSCIYGWIVHYKPIILGIPHDLGNPTWTQWWFGVWKMPGTSFGEVPGSLTSRLIPAMQS